MRFVVTSLAILSTSTALMAHDIVILGGRVIGSETGLGIIRNIIIEGDKIAAFSDTVPMAPVAFVTDEQGRSDWTLDVADPEQSVGIASLIKQGLKDGVLGIGDNVGFAAERWSWTLRMVDLSAKQS